MVIVDIKGLVVVSSLLFPSLSLGHFLRFPACSFFFGGGCRNLVGVGKEFKVPTFEHLISSPIWVGTRSKVKKSGHCRWWQKSCASWHGENPIWILYCHYVGIHVEYCGMGFHVHPGNFTRKKMEKVFPFKYGNPAIKFQRKGSALQNRTWGKIQKSKGKTVRPTKKTKTKGREETRGKIW